MLSIKIVRRTKEGAQRIRTAIIESLGGEEILPILKNFTITDVAPSNANNDKSSYVFFILFAKNNPLVRTFIKVPEDSDITWQNETMVVEDKDADKFII